MLSGPWWLIAILGMCLYAAATIGIPRIGSGSLQTSIYQQFIYPLTIFSYMLWGLSGCKFIIWLFNRARKRRLVDKQKDINSVRELHWREFEEMVAEAYRRRGYRVKEGGYGADGGIDLELRKDGELVFVQCKQWKSQKIGVNIVREMFGVLMDSKASRMIVIGSGSFTTPAKEFVVGKPVELIDGPMLVQLLQGVQKDALINSEVAAACPKCGHEMVERIAKRGKNAGNRFLGCSNFPTCRHIE